MEKYKQPHNFFNKDGQELRSPLSRTTVPRLNLDNTTPIHPDLRNELQIRVN